MAIQNMGLGKGLNALIRETNDIQSSSGVRMLSLEDIIPNPRQPRKNFDEIPLDELAQSIKSQGLLQPLLVRPIGTSSPGKYEIVAGERRWRASQLAGLKEVPVLVKDLTPEDTLAAALIENLQREDLNPIEEAQGIHTLKEEFGLSQDMLAQRLGKSRSAIANSLRLLTLPTEIHELIIHGELSAGHARTLLSINDSEAQQQLKDLIIGKQLSVREAEGLAAAWKQTGVFTLSEAGSDDRLSKKSDGSTAQSEGAEKNSRAKPQSARILEIQNRISDLFNIPVRVTGKETKGKISFAYNSREELEQLLSRLATNVLESEERVVLASRSNPVLMGSKHNALDHKNQDILDSASLNAIEGSTRISLDTRELTKLDTQDNKPLDYLNLQKLSGSDAGLLSHLDLPVLDTAKKDQATGSADVEVQANDQTHVSPTGDDTKDMQQEDSLDPFRQESSEEANEDLAETQDDIVLPSTEDSLLTPKEVVSTQVEYPSEPTPEDDSTARNDEEVLRDTSVQEQKRPISDEEATAIMAEEMLGQGQ